MNHSQGAWKLHANLSVPVAVTGRENINANGGSSSLFDEKPSSANQFSAVPMQLSEVSNVMSRVASSGCNSLEVRAPSPVVATVPTVSWSSTTSSPNILPLPPVYPPQKHPRASFDFRNHSYSIINQGHQHSETDDKRNLIPAKPAQRPQFSFTPLPHLTQQPPSFQQQLHRPQEPRQNAVPTVSPLPPQMRLPSASLGYTPVGHGFGSNNIIRNPVSGPHPAMPILNVPNGSMHFQAPMAPLPLVPRPVSQFLPLPQSSGPLANQPPAAAISGLLNSLVSQGLLKQTPVQVNEQ